MTSLSSLQGSHEALFGLRVRELFNEGFSEQLVNHSLCEQAACPGSCELQNWIVVRSKYSLSLSVTLGRISRMEIDILEIRFDTWAIWHARGELPMFLASLSRSLGPSRAMICELAAARFFWLR